MHGVSFEDAVKVFADPDRTEIIDERDDCGEERIQVLGRVMSEVLFVVYVERGGVYRIISARKATRHEEATYYSHDP
jgi:hypothetical protein